MTVKKIDFLDLTEEERIAVVKKVIDDVREKDREKMEAVRASIDAEKAERDLRWKKEREDYKDSVKVFKKSLSAKIREAFGCGKLPKFKFSVSIKESIGYPPTVWMKCGEKGQGGDRACFYDILSDEQLIFFRQLVLDFIEESGFSANNKNISNQWCL